MRLKGLLFSFIVLCALPLAGMADDLTRMAQQELSALGYDIDNTEGEATTKTVVAISKFQAENNLEVTGEASPQLIGALRAASKAGSGAAGAAPAPVAARPMTPQEQEADLQARRQACLEEKVAAAQERDKKKRGFRRLLNAVSRTSRQFGDGGLAGDISRASWEVYSVDATAADLEAAGKDLGLTPEEMEQCRNPG